jgi:hypothetical protein
VVLALALAAARPAAAQDAGRSPADARASAESARKAAAQAQQELEAAQRALDEAEARVTERKQKAAELEAAVDGPEPEKSPEPEKGAGPAAAADDTRQVAADAAERAERAERRAKAAERQAQEALDRIEVLESRFAYDRTGFYLGGSAFYAPEAFDEEDSVSVKSSRGATARIGYRLHSLVAFDVRADYLDDFDVFTGDASGEIDGYAITGNVRAFLLPYRFQPWMGFGVGAIRTDFDARLADGEKIETDGVETDPMFRFAAGFDTYLTSSLVLTVETAINIVTDDRDYINYGQLAVGLDFRF